MRPARCLVLANIMAPHEAKMFEVPAGTRLRELDPKGRFPSVCRLNGAWTLRKDWERLVGPGDVVEFYEYPQGGGDEEGGGSNAGRIVLTIVALYLAVQFGQWWGLQSYVGGAAAGTAIAQIALSMLINALVPVDTGNGLNSGTTDSPSYSTSLSGNQSRMDQAIPVLYGRNKTYPDFAAQPYSTYENDDQYFHALLCLGQGSYKIESMLIDDTNLNNFSEVTTKAVLPPGALPSIVSAAVVTAPEVTGNPLTEGRYIGPFVACRPQETAVSVGIDITFSRGLATYDGTGAPTNKTVDWRVEYRQVDDFGAGTTPWSTLATESLTAAQTKPIRKSYEYTLPSAMRPQVRLVRLTPFDSNSRVANTIEWGAMRAKLSSPAPLSVTATHIEIRMRATDQLSGLTQRRIAVISRRKLRTWTGTAWTAEVETRNMAWALADKWTNAAYGDGYPDDRCDLAGLKLMAAKLDARQDRFDGVFDTTYDSFQADQMIAQSGRCAVFRRGAVMTLTRDEQKSLPTTAFTPRNIDPGSTTIDYKFADENAPDGVIVEYWHNRAWDWREVTCPAPGVVTPIRAQRMRLFGVTGPTHALREGTYQAANSYWRRRYASFTTELEGMLPAFGSAVVFAPNLTGWGRSGDVVDYSAGDLTLRVSEPLVWTAGATHYISVLQRNGTLSTPLQVLPGVDSYEVILPSALAETPSIDVAEEERTKFIFGVSKPYEKILRVLSIRDSTEQEGRRKFSISGLIEDDQVHTADNAWLPVDGVIQDSVDNSPDDGSGSGGALIPYLDTFNADATLGNDQAKATLHVRNTGIAESVLELDSVVYGPTRLTGQWLLAAPHSPASAALFDVRVTLASGVAPSGSLLGSWLNLGTDHSWYVEVIGSAGYVGSGLLVEIRETSTGIVQASASWGLSARTRTQGS